MSEKMSRAEILAELLDVEARRRALQKREGELRNQLLLADEAVGGASDPLSRPSSRSAAFTPGCSVKVINIGAARYGQVGKIVGFVRGHDLPWRVQFPGGYVTGFAVEELAAAAGATWR